MSNIFKFQCSAQGLFLGHLANSILKCYIYFDLMFSCVFVTFPCGVLGQVWYLIVSIPDLCLLTYFDCNIVP